MKRITIGFGLWVCLIVIIGIGTAQAAASTQSELIQTFQHYQRSLTLPATVSPQQRALIAAELTSVATGGEVSPALLSLLSPAQVDTTLYEQSDTSFVWNTSQWTPNIRSTFSYNTSNLSSSEIVDTFDGASWTHTTEHLYTFTASLKVLSDTGKVWASGAWTNHGLNTYTYDGSGNLTQFLLLGWNGSAYENQYRVTNKMTGGLLDSELVEQWSTNVWVNSSLHTYSYDGSGRVTQVLAQTWQSTAWVNQSLTTNTYNLSGDQTQSIQQFWQSNAWTNISKHTYGYNGSHQQTLDTTSSWAVSVWFASMVDSTKYSGSLVSERVHASLFGAGSTRTDYTYDAYGDKVIEVNLDWNLALQQWDNSSRTVYVYGAIGPISCCVGKRGNVNGTGIVDLADLSSLVNYLQGGGYVLPCPNAANVNGAGIIDLADLSSLVNYLQGGGYVLPNCP